MNVGLSLNGNDYHSNITKGFIEVNPNKVASFEQFWTDFNTIKNCCKYFSVARCDIALDIPVKREFLILEKGNKKYTPLIYSHSNRTEYLGKRSTVGNIKLYNKTIKSKLDYDLSRLEVTCLLTAESYKQHFPKVYCLSQIDYFGELNCLKDTERAIVEMTSRLIRSGDNEALIIFNSMGRGMKNKLKKFIAPESSRIIYSEDTINQLIKNTQELYL